MNFRNLPLALMLAILTPQAFGQAETYEIDPVHTSVYFKVGHLGVSNVYGRFNDVAGTFTIDEENPANNQVELTVNANSIDTNNDKRDEHLRSKDFFNVVENPVITFKSTGFEKTDKGYDVTGDLTLHGTTKSVTLPVEKTGEGEGMRGEYRAGYETEYKLKRSDYGMDKMLNLVGDEVTLAIAVEGVRQDHE